MRRIGWMVGVSVLVLLMAESIASAQVPPACSSASLTQAYNARQVQGRSLVRSAWRGVDQDCDRVEELADAVAESIAITASITAPSARAKCMYSGWVAAMQDELDTILATCADSCFQEGTFMGELAAIAYCELAIALGGLGLDDLFIRGPVDVCGLGFEVGCDERFQSTGLTYFSDVQGAACSEYTRGQHLAVFRRTQHNQCAYNPLDPEDP